MADPITQYQYQTNIPSELMPYAQDLLGKAEALTSQTPYQPYEGEQIAQFSPLQQRSYDYASQLTTSPQLQNASAMAGLAGLGALNTQYGYQPSDFTAAQAQRYMSPYMQNVVDVQKQQAIRDASIAQQQRQAQATQAGAFGGGRDAIMRSQANAELQRNLQNIQATGLQNAYQQAQQQYNTQYGQNAAQQQFGAGLGMQGLGIANQAAANLGALGQTQYGQNVGLIGLQNQLGLQQQQQAQNILNTQYQNYQNRLNYPYKNLGFMSDIIRGVPLAQSSQTMYQAAPTGMQNLTSLGLGAYGLSSLFGGKSSGNAEGGQVKSYAYGGSVLSDGFKEYAVGQIDPRQLPLAQRNAQMRGDLGTSQYALEEIAKDAALRRGIAPALPAGTNVVRASGGGILAFQEGGTPSEQDLSYSTEGSSGSGGDFTDMQLAQLAGMAGDGQSVESGNQGIYAAASNAALNTAKEIRALRYQGYTDDQINDIIKKRFALEEQLAGPSPYGEMQKYLASAKTDRAAALEQGKGLAALEAAGAVLQPGGTMRGLGAAGSAFAKSYGQALQADRAEKRALASMQFNLTDAQRKERMGMTKSAIAAAAEAEKNRRDAYTAGLNKLKAQGDIEAKVAAANRPIKIGAGAGKVAPQTEAYNTYYKYYKEIYPEKSDAAIGKMAMDKALEMKAPGLPGVQARIEGTALETAKARRDKRLTNDVAYLAAQRKNDLVGMAKRSEEILMEQLAKPDTDSGDGGGGANLVYDPKTKTFK